MGETYVIHAEERPTNLKTNMQPVLAKKYKNKRKINVCKRCLHGYFNGEDHSCYATRQKGKKLYEINKKILEKDTIILTGKNNLNFKPDYLRKMCLLDTCVQEGKTKFMGYCTYEHFKEGITLTCANPKCGNIVPKGKKRYCSDLCRYTWRY